MKTLPTSALLALLTMASAFADPATGASRADVLAELGEPSSRLAVSDRELFTYDRGTVLFVDGRVAKTRLLPEAVYARRLAEENRRREAAEQTALATARALSALTASEDWETASGAGRVTMLLNFRTNRPDADIAGLLKIAERRRDREFAEAAAQIARTQAAETAPAPVVRVETPPVANDPPVIITGGRLLREPGRFADDRRHSRPEPARPEKPAAPTIRRDLDLATPAQGANRAVPDQGANRATPRQGPANPKTDP